MDKKSLSKLMRENFQTMTAFNQNNISILSSIPNLQEFKDDALGHNVSTQVTKEIAQGILQRCNKSTQDLDYFEEYTLVIYTDYFQRVDRTSSNKSWLSDKQAKFDNLEVQVKLILGKGIKKEFTPNIISLVNKSVLVSTNRGVLELVRESPVTSPVSIKAKNPDSNVLIMSLNENYNTLYTEVLNFIGLG